MAAIQSAATSETTLEDALHAAPELLRACMRMWGPHFGNAEEPSDPGLLRTLRLVSKSVGQIALKAVSSFSLVLLEEGIFREASPSLLDMERMVRLLQHSQLKALSVRLCIPRCHRLRQRFDHEDGDDDCAAPPTPLAWLQLKGFITSMGPLLSSVQKLVLDTPTSGLFPSVVVACAFMKLVAASSPLLAGLATACPNLTWLRLCGEIGPTALSAFGANCSKITRVELVSNNIPVTSLHHLHEYFPSMQHFEVQKDDSARANDEAMQNAAMEYCTHAAHALSLCSNLKTLILPSLHIRKAGTWTYFPKSLTTLNMFACSRPPPVGCELPALQELIFDLNYTPTNKRGCVRTVAAILQATPCLIDFVGRVEATCDVHDQDSIMIVYARIEAGLFTLPLTIRNPDLDIGMFLSFFQPLPLLTNLHVLGGLPNDGLGEIVRVFPKLDSLFLTQPGSMDESADLLMGLASLKTLTIYHCSNLTDAGVLMCMHLPSLTSLSIRYCPNVSSAEVLQELAREGLVIDREEG